MTVENEGSKEAPPGEGEAGSIVPKETAAAAPPRASAGKEEKKLRIVLQVEVRAEIDAGDESTKATTNVNKISVVSEHIRAIVNVIGGGD